MSKFNKVGQHLRHVRFDFPDGTQEVYDAFRATPRSIRCYHAYTRQRGQLIRAINARIHAIEHNGNLPLQERIAQVRDLQERERRVEARYARLLRNGNLFGAEMALVDTYGFKNIDVVPRSEIRWLMSRTHVAASRLEIARMVATKIKVGVQDYWPRTVETPEQFRDYTRRQERQLLRYIRRECIAHAWNVAEAHRDFYVNVSSGFTQGIVRQNTNPYAQGAQEGSAAC